MNYVHRLNGDIIGSGANPQTDRAPELADESNAEWVGYTERRVIPESVSNRQGMLALIEFDHIATVEAMIFAIEDTKSRRKAEAELNASTWEFNSPFLRSMWFSIPDATETQLEDLFIYANQQ